jgi:putative flippase GtrA
MPASRATSRLRAPLRFGIVGVANTATGLAVIAVALAVGLGDVPANALGYAAGLAQGFVLNRRWTFQRAAAPLGRQIARYLAAFVPAYGLNLLVVTAFVSAGVVGNPLTHLLAVAVYTGAFYLLCARYVFRDAASAAAGDARPRLGAAAARMLDRRWGPEALAAVALVVAYGVLRDMPITHDVVWQFWIARQLLHGARLYVDILEINPPMWFWSAVPLEALAEAAGIPSKRMAVAALFVLIALAVALLSRLYAEETGGRRAAIALAACAALVVVPLSDFGQREHLALIGAVPYAVLIGRRAEARPTGIGLAALVGLLAAYGFSLKHYFVAVPLILELWLAMRRSPAWRPLRPETVVLIVVAALYGLAVWRYAPGLFSDILPMVSAAYGGYEAPLADQLRTVWVCVWVVGAFAMLRLRNALPPVVAASALAALGFAFAYFAQQKGWRYHALGASGCLSFAAGLAIVHWQGARTALLRHPGVPFAAAAPILIALAFGPYVNPYEEPARRVFSMARPGATMAALSIDAALMWPMIDDASQVWPLRYFTYWMIPAVARAEARAEAHAIAPELRELERRIQHDTAQDLWCRPPEIIVVDDTRYGASMRGLDFDILRFFRRDPSIDALMKHYRKAGVFERYVVYTRIDALSTPGSLTCRSIVASR